ncbi:hypothetical protein ARMGADRAFT_1031995 [Armillaria gallica]|uniref:F-box domain-containing protein n=1 Tax=Armillaria gallica TaxID=47427 RepID=A0A2H3DJ63_ARMGA|nr:hypothetical protein ARMGADRAFT_1031995 [Armillaria gallica]
MDPLFLPSEMIFLVLENLHVGRNELDSRHCIVSGKFLDIMGRLLSGSGSILTHATFLLIVDFGPAFEDVISLCPTLKYLDVGFTPLRENIDEVFLFINQQNMLPALQTLKIAFRNCNVVEAGQYIREWFVQMAMSQKHSSLRIFEGSMHIKANEELPYATILNATNNESLEELKAEGMSIMVRMTAKRTTWEQSLEFA